MVKSFMFVIEEERGIEKLVPKKLIRNVVEDEECKVSDETMIRRLYEDIVEDFNLYESDRVLVYKQITNVL